MVIVRGNSVANDLAQDWSVARTRAFQVFKREYRRAFAENHSGTVAIERTTFFRCRCLQRIESDKDQFGDSVIAAREHSLIFSRTNAFECMPDGIRARSAGIGDDL